MMTKAKSMAVHEELNSMLRQGQRECLHLNGLIRKLKSGQAMLMMKKDKAKKELEVYVNKMSESLIEFKSEMHVTIQSEVDAKVKEMTSLREKYEAYIRSYMELCDETEKLVRFGKVIVTEADLHKARELLNEFSHMQEVSSEKFELDALMKLEFYPALPIECISSSIFGDLIKGAYYKPTKSSLSTLSARKSRSVNDLVFQAHDKSNSLSSVSEKKDQCTQTDSAKELVLESTNRGRTCDTSGYNYTQYGIQQNLGYPQTSPPGFECVPLSYCTFDSFSASNPPPGFQVFQQLADPYLYQPDQKQMNSCMLTGEPFCQQGSQCSKSYKALAAPPLLYPVQNIPLHTCNRPVSLEQTCLYQTNQPYSPLKSCMIPTTSGTGVNLHEVSKEKNEKSEKDKVAKYSKSDHQSMVKNIPFPVGPAPRESIVDCKSEKQVAEQMDSESDQSGNVADVIYSKTVKQEKCENRDSRFECGMKNENAGNMEKFENLLKRTTKLLESSSIGEMNEIERSTESSETVGEILDVKNGNLIKDQDMSKVLKIEKKSPINKMEIDQMLSNIGHDFKEKITQGKEIVFPMKPLRRPLRLPKNLFTEPKTKADSETMSTDLVVNEQLSDRKKDTKEHLEINETFRSDRKRFKVGEITKKLESDKTKGQAVSVLEYAAETAAVKTEEVFVKQEVTESLDGQDILNLSSSTGVKLREVVNGQGLSKRKITEMNKECLQLQTSWLKSYLKQILPDGRDKASSLEVCDENNNSLKECAQFELMGENPKVCVNGKGDKDYTELESSVSVSEAESIEIAEKECVLKENTIEKLTDFSDKIDSKAKNSKDTNEESSSFSHVEESNKTNAEPNKSSDVHERRADLKNLKSAVKGFLGDQKEGKQRSTSTYSRLGALQAHWLKHTPGTSIRAKFLFECSQKMHFPIGVTANRLKQIIVADTGNHCVKIFDQDGNFIRDFKAEGMRRPSAVVVNEFDHIFVKDDVSIRVFDNHGDYITEIAKDLNKPFGLVLTPAKCLLVLETDRRRPALVHISQDGCEMWRFPYTPLMNAPIGSKCRFMGVSENNVVVSDLGLSRIYITNLEGMFFKMIGSFGTGFMQFIEPSGISVDNYGNIVIGDSKNNRIQVYRHDGSYTGLVHFDEKVTRPSGVHLTSDNKLLVVNFLHHVVRVYQLQA